MKVCLWSASVWGTKEKDHVSCGRRICLLCVSMTPSSHHSTFSLRPLNHMTTHHNNNNNNGNKRFSFPCTRHFRLPLLVLGFFFYCLLVYNMLRLFFISFLVNFKRHISAWSINYSMLSRLQWIHVDANILETMPRKKDRFGTCGRGLKSTTHKCNCNSELTHVLNDSVRTLPHRV